MTKYKVGIVGYGNLGRGVECALKRTKDMEPTAIYTRRDPATVTPLTEGLPIYAMETLETQPDGPDVLILCGGSATDLPVQTPSLARRFHVVDSFDTHPKIPEHFAAVDAASREGGKVSVISAGWDPGLFSLTRAVASAVLPSGENYTFWGKGVSQGHSDAIRRIPGVKDARQHTIPVPSALDAVRGGGAPSLTTREKHTRECFVVAHEGADRAAIKHAIVTMPDYFEPYDTTVHFITEEELLRDHSGLPHGGFVIRSGRIGWEEEHRAVVEYRLTLDSNPEFTASVLAACARAACRMAEQGQTGCKTIFDLSASALSPLSPEELRKTLL